VTAPGRSVFPVMGTMTSILVAQTDRAVLGDAAVDVALGSARRQLELLDRRFSHYSAESEISTWLTGGSISPDAVADFDYVLRQCGRLRDESGGVFTVKNPATGTVDTAGYVKGYAIRRAAEVLRAHGVRNFLLCVGGDTFCSGHPDADRPWRVAVADPERSHGVAALVEVSDLAVATSGTSERGEHIWNGVAPTLAPLLSFTVIGPDAAEADAYATIGFAMGEDGVGWVARRNGYRSMAIRTDGSIVGDAALVSVA
jgi:thiamine biosynthesis lipoprotein